MNQTDPTALWQHLVQWQPATAAALAQHVRALPHDWPLRVFGVGRPDAALLLPPGATGEQFPDRAPEIAPYDETASLDDCPACWEVGGTCRWHEGYAAGHHEAVQAQLDAVRVNPGMGLREFMRWRSDVEEAEDRGEEPPAMPAAASAVVSPPTSRAELRDRIAEALYPTYGQQDRNRSLAIADAVLAVLGGQTDRAVEARVRALHQQYRFAGDDTTDYCAHCNQLSGGWIPWPCPTVRALDGEQAVDTHGTETQQQDEAREVFHGCPPDGSGLTPCCGRTPFELPLGDRISSEAPITCTAPAPVAQQPAAEARRCVHCTHPKSDHDGRADHRTKYSPLVAGEPWCHACNAACDYAPVEQQPAADGDEEHVCKPGATVYYCPTVGEVESDCHGGFDVCCSRPDLHRLACGKTQGVGGHRYSPCARTPGHREAYCVSANGHQLFLATEDATP
ncbi:hypothetical protein [Streptomyces capoamus]|uniref:hypothetical protein n=1 Tax=Streptomyces capoamus TaxID=68183 RepID=UPI003396C6B7